MKNRLLQINEKIDDIEYFIEMCGGRIMSTLQDRVYRPATRMHLITIAEHFNKLQATIVNILNKENPKNERNL